MFFSYSASVIVVSLALYGLWYVIKDIWNWFNTLEFVRLPDASLIILVRNMEHEIEELVRYLVGEMHEGGHEYDAVLVDCGSDDLTPIIMARLASDCEILTVISAGRTDRPVSEALPLCRGAVVHVFDLTSRLSMQEFMVVTTSLFRHNKREIAVRAKGKEGSHGDGEW